MISAISRSGIKKHSSWRPMLRHYGHQVAGHGILESYKGNVAKPLVQKEYNFYEATQQKYPDLFKWIPAYYGKTMIEQKEYIILEDLLANMKKPSVIDLKIGRRTYAEDATPEKKESMTKKSLNSSSHVIGFRISGMKVYCPQKRKYANFDKIRCREVSRTPESVAHGLDIFFSELDPIRRQGLLLQSILPILHKLSKDISELSATLYSSSLLIAFDGSTLAEVDESIPFVVKIIDFAHSQWEEGPSFDKKILSDYLDGLNNVIHHLERIAQ